jgi:hypothetical protein
MKCSYDIFGNFITEENKQTNSNNKQIEKFNNISTDVKTAVNQIYQADIDSIRNLSNVATKLQTGSLTVPGPMVTNNLQLAPGQWAVNHKGERHSYIVNDDTHYKKLMLVGNNIAGGAREVGLWDNLTVNGNTNVSGDLIKNGGNNWVFHTPDDGRRTLEITPSKAYGNQDWNWDKATKIDENGNISIRGNLTLPNGWLISGDNDALRVYKNNNPVFHIRNDGHVWSAPYGDYISTWVGNHYQPRGDYINNNDKIWIVARNGGQDRDGNKVQASNTANEGAYEQLAIKRRP